MKRSFDLMLESISDRGSVLRSVKSALKDGNRLADLLKELESDGLLKDVIPELSAMKGFEHSKRNHPEGGVWDHTLAALRKSDSDDVVVNAAIMLHDIGKPLTHSKGSGDDEHRYYNHDTAGMRVAKNVAVRIGMNIGQAEDVAFLVGNHMSLHRIRDMRPSRVMNIVSHPLFDSLLKVCKADETCRGNVGSVIRWNREMDWIENVKRSFEPTEEEIIRKKISGKEVMRILEIPPGPEVGRAIDIGVEWAVKNGVDDEETIYDHIKNVFGKSST